MSRTLPEWSKDALEYVEPTQVARSFGYDVFASEYNDDETFAWNQKTISCVAEVDGDVANRCREYPDVDAAAGAIKENALRLGAAMVGITKIDPRHVYKDHDLQHEYGIVIAVPMDYEEMKYGATARLAQQCRGYRRGWGADAGDPERGPA